MCEYLVIRIVTGCFKHCMVLQFRLNKFNIVSYKVIFKMNHNIPVSLLKPLRFQLVTKRVFSFWTRNTFLFSFLDSGFSKFSLDHFVFCLSHNLQNNTSCYRSMQFFKSCNNWKGHWKLLGRVRAYSWQHYSPALPNLVTRIFDENALGTRLRPARRSWWLCKSDAFFSLPLRWKFVVQLDHRLIFHPLTVDSKVLLHPPGRNWARK